MRKDASRRTLPLRFAAAVFGIFTHSLFLFAVWSMFRGIESGLHTGHGGFHGSHAILANTFLILQFPLLHSYLLTKRGQRILRVLCGPFGKDMSTTVYALIASSQLILIFHYWSPYGHVLWAPHKFGAVASYGLYLFSWLYLAVAMADAGLSVQSGSLGWSSIVRNIKPTYPKLPTNRTFRLSRQPIYLAFMLIMWTAPTHTQDGLVLAAAWSLYCLVGPLLKERRFLSHFGEKFREYASVTPYFFPRPKQIFELLKFLPRAQ